jgi:hypothetical protein
VSKEETDRKDPIGLGRDCVYLQLPAICFDYECIQSKDFVEPLDRSNFSGFYFGLEKLKF